jgi:hypothetical protein
MVALLAVADRHYRAFSSECSAGYTVIASSTPADSRPALDETGMALTVMAGLVPAIGSGNVP